VRHVLAAAVKCGAHSIVSDNGKHFPTEALSPYNLECLTAEDFMTHQYHLNPDAFITPGRSEPHNSSGRGSSLELSEPSYRHEDPIELVYNPALTSPVGSAA
jgi:hypothetical protein